jgi:WhiB family redox-sensing transcriptional regulator
MRGPRTEWDLIPDRRDLRATLRLLADRGKCAGADDPDRWWKDLPRGHANAVEFARKRAADLCGGCPVLEQCRWYAIEAGEAHGVWGGLSDVDRALRHPGRSSRARLRPLSVPTCSAAGGGDAA